MAENNADTRVTPEERAALVKKVVEASRANTIWHRSPISTLFALIARR